MADDSHGGTAADDFGYQTDYAARSREVRVWHQTGSDREPGAVNPLYYGDSNPSGDMQWSVDPSKIDTQSNPTQENIDTVKSRIDGLDTGQVDTAAAGWGKIASIFDDMVSTIGSMTQKMSEGDYKGGGWKSPAANVFYAKGPGATMKSLKDWSDSAHANQQALQDISKIIGQYKGKMATLYSNYLADRRILDAAWNKFWSGVEGGLGEKAPTTGAGLKNPEDDLSWTPTVYIDMIKRHRAGALKPTNDVPALNDQWEVYNRYKWSGGSDTNWNKQAASLQYNMAQQFNPAINKIYSEGRSTRYEGPTDAVTVDPNVVQQVLQNWLAQTLPGTPNINVPSVSVPDVTPPMVIMPNLPTVPDVPNLISALEATTLPDPSTLPAVNVPSLSGLDVNVPGGLPGAAPDLSGLAGLAVPGLAGLTGLTATNLPNVGLAKGLLSAPNAGGAQAGLPSSPFSAAGGINKDTKRNLQRGVLGSRRSTFGEEVPQDDEHASTGMPPSAGTGGIPQRRDAKQQLPGSPVARETFGGEGMSAPTSPSVLGRSQDRTSRQVSRPGPRQEAPGGHAFSPGGTTRPVLGRSQAAPGAPGNPGPNRQRDARHTGPAQPQVPSESDWVTRTSGDTPPASAPVLDGSGRMSEAERARSAWSERFTAAPTQHGATAPVLGRPGSAAAVGGGATAPAGRPVAPDLGTRHHTAAGVAASAAAGYEEQSPVISDETAFSVETPGGAVLGGDAGRPTAPEAEPKPTLGAGQ